MLTRDELVAEVARLRRALEWIAEYGSRDGDLREEDSWLGAVREIAHNTLAIDPTCSLCQAGHVPARPCGPVKPALDERAVGAAAQAYSRYEFNGVLPDQCTWEGLASGRVEGVRVILAAYFATLDPGVLLQPFDELLEALTHVGIEGEIGHVEDVDAAIVEATEAWPRLRADLGLFTPDTEEPA